MKSICVFDLDGTLVDSMPRYTAGMYKVLDEDGILYAPDLIKILTPLGYTKSAEYYINELGVQGTVESIVSRMEENLVYEYTNNIKLKPGVEAYLKQRKEEGASLYVLTASPHIVTDPCLKSNGVFDLFDKIWSVEDFGLSKSGTELFYKVAETLGCETSDIAFFDDHPVALENAKASGMETYGVLDRQAEEDVKKIKEIGDYFVQGFDIPFRKKPDGETAICRFCGTEVSGGIKNCPKCGERVFTDAERQAMREQEEARRQEIKKRNRTMTFSILGVVVGFLLITVLRYWLDSRQFVAGGSWSSDNVFTMKEADLRLELPKGYYNLTDMVETEEDSAMDMEAIVASESGARILYIARTTEKMTNPDGSPLSDVEVLEYYTEGDMTGMPEGSQVHQVGTSDEEEFRGHIYQRAYFNFTVSGEGGYMKILVRKEKESFIMIMAMYITDAAEKDGIRGLDQLTNMITAYDKE